MPIQEINDLGQFQTALQSAQRKLVVVDFYAAWCGPCVQISPFVEGLSTEFTDVVFIKVNVDYARGIAGNYQITAMPTFLFFRDGNEVERLRGANPNRLRELIQQFASQIGPSAPNPRAANASEKEFLQQFVHHADRMQIYEDEISQTLALSLVPLEEIQAKATIDGKVKQYLLAKYLMAWFHDSFFKWTDKPTCEKCNVKVESNGRNGTPFSEEIADDAQRVEVYECQQCKSEVRFPRYNNPLKLLETRNGRCGEWANCFALFCRSIGLETRFVQDNLDHVWVEIFAEELDRWIHCDACENVMDTPLMYESGWNKKYAYVMAFSKDHVKDVTWRYTFDRKLTTKRRTRCRPAVFFNFVTKLSNRLSKNLPQERQKELQRRDRKEVIEFLWPLNNKRDGSEAENHGRISGSKQWKESRGEVKPSSSYIIKPTPSEIESKCLEINYNAATDEYRRLHDASSSKSYKSLAFECKNVFRKTEEDWKKVYLCRSEGSDKGEIVWKIEFNGEKPKSVTINYGEPFCRDDGNVLGVVCCGEQCVRISSDGVLVMSDFNDEATYLEMRVEFTGGKGNNAWQHAQLFRCDLDNKIPNLSIRVEFH